MPDPGQAAQQRGQAAFLVIIALVAILPLLGLVVNTGRAARGKVETQNVVDKSAYASAGTTARLLNLSANLNIAMLDLTAILAMMDAVEPTYEGGMWSLFWEELGASIFGGSAALSAKIAQERYVLNMFRAAGQAFGRFRPQIEALRRFLGRAQRTVVGQPLRTAPTAAAYAAAASEPDGVVLVPTAVLPRFPIGYVRLAHYWDKGRERLREMDRPIYYQLMATTTLSGAWYVWREATEDSLRRLSQLPEPLAAAFDRRPNQVTRRWVDRFFRFAWSGVRSGGPLVMPGLFGATAPYSTAALAEARVGNPLRFDLVTPRFDAALVPVTKHFGARGLPVHH
ncbi:MAG: pilus assembly protein TadG-related protein [Planctomycetota bacterium]